MSNHTPGPWSLRGRTIRGPHPKDPKGRTRIVANAIWDRGTYVDEAEANAYLIAAAPELLEALEYYVEKVADLSRYGVIIETSLREKAEAAIAKAKDSQSYP